MISEMRLGRIAYCKFTDFFIILNLIYYKYSKTDKKETYFINLTILLVFITLLLFTLIYYKNINSITNNLLAFAIYYISINLILKMINEADNIINMHMNLKEFAKEKNIKLNLFRITHEIKNPLSVIYGYLQMFDIKDKERSEKYLNIIKNELERTLNLLHDFMDFTKIKINKEEMNFTELMIEIKDILLPFFNSKNVNYSFNVEDNLIMQGDYNRLKQVVLNIIKNDFQFMEEQIEVPNPKSKKGETKKLTYITMTFQWPYINKGKPVKLELHKIENDHQKGRK